MESINQKIEKARLQLYTIKGSLISPEVLRASQKLDEYIVTYYKDQAIKSHKEGQTSA